MPLLFAALLCILLSSGPAPELRGADVPLTVELSGSPLRVKFTNVSDQQIRILKPLDGSAWCWLMPHYRLSVRRDGGEELPSASRCKMYGLWSGLEWPSDYIVDIPPGGAFVHEPSVVSDIPAAGEYDVQFEYVFRPGDNNRVFKEAYPPGVWVGQAISNTIRTMLTPSQ